MATSRVTNSAGWIPAQKGRATAMEEENTGVGTTSSRARWNHLEDFVREHIPRLIQSVMKHGLYWSRSCRVAKVSEAVSPKPTVCLSMLFSGL